MRSLHCEHAQSSISCQPAIRCVSPSSSTWLNFPAIASEKLRQILIFKMADSELQRSCQLRQQQLLSQGTSFPFHTEQYCEQNFEGPSINESRSASPSSQVGLEVGGQHLGLLEHGLAARTICQPSDDGDLIELIREKMHLGHFTPRRSFKETPKKQRA